MQPFIHCFLPSLILEQIISLALETMWVLFQSKKIEVLKIEEIEVWLFSHPHQTSTICVTENHILAAAREIGKR